jgi:hypothetical protein
MNYGIDVNTWNFVSISTFPFFTTHPSIFPQHGETALMIAGKDQPEIMQLLLDGGADIHQVDQVRSYPL